MADYFPSVVYIYFFYSYVRQFVFYYIVHSNLYTIRLRENKLIKDTIRIHGYTNIDFDDKGLWFSHSFVERISGLSRNVLQPTSDTCNHLSECPRLVSNETIIN